MGLLDGDIARAIYAGFRGKLKSGLIRQAVVASSGGLDSYGDPIDSEPTDTACQGFTENYSAYSHAQLGIPKTDIQVSIFAQSIPGITPKQSDLVYMNANWYQVRRAEIDPAGALWECQAFPVQVADA